MSETRCPKCGGLNGAHNLVHVRYGNGGGGNKPCPNATCTCVVDCAEHPPTACSLSGAPHVHPDDGSGTFGPCPVHPDAPGDH